MSQGPGCGERRCGVNNPLLAIAKLLITKGGDMVATITLQLDDQTGPGWAQFIENVRNAEQQADALQRTLDKRTAIAGVGQQATEIAGLASALGAAAETAQTLNGCLCVGAGPTGRPPQVQSPWATSDDRQSVPFDSTSGIPGEAERAGISPDEFARPYRLQARSVAAQRQQFQQTQLASSVSGQGLESEQTKTQNQLLQAAVNRARVQRKVDAQIVQMLTDQIEFERQQQQAAGKTGQILQNLQTALTMLLNATNSGAQQNRQGQQLGGP